MSNYKEDVKRLAELCRKCRGECCNGGPEGSCITISKRELKRLHKILDFEYGTLKSPYGSMNKIIIKKNRPCPFLGNAKGKQASCILEYKARSLSCRLFPLTFVMEKDKPKFYLSGFCPYAKEASDLKSWIKKTVKEAEKELETWTETEKLCRSYWHKSHGNLFEISY